MRTNILTICLLMTSYTTESANISRNDYSQLPPAAKRVAHQVISHLKRKKVDDRTINIKLNKQLKALEESSKYQFHLISSKCSRDSFYYCNKNISEKKLEKINSQGLFFLTTMDCIKKTYKSYSKVCQSALKKNKVIN